jgi:hypothetical protein
MSSSCGAITTATYGSDPSTWETWSYVASRALRMHKLSAPWEGPFIVMEFVSPSTYHLQWADGQGVPNVWN